MKRITVVLDLLATGSGVYAACLWFQASAIPLEELWSNLKGLEENSVSRDEMRKIIDAFNQSSALNKEAAIWTLVAVFFTATASFASAFMC
jgi:hypothetical protein